MKPGKMTVTVLVIKFINIFVLLLLFIVIPTVEIKFVEVLNQF